MKKTDRLFSPVMSNALTVVGGTMLVFALLADWIVGGAPGIGLHQLLLAGAGALLIIAGGVG